MEAGTRIETVVVGGGQAGLAVGYHLAKRRRPFLILDAHPRIGEAWRRRWDSLQLFTPARFNGLPGMAFPGPGHAFVTKDQMADFLEAYAARFALPVRTGARVDRLTRREDKFHLTVGEHVYVADNVIVAMANYQAPRLPQLAGSLAPEIVQLHSSAYRNPGQLQPGEVLVVGAGNSGADIALETARTHRTWLSGKDVGEIPFRIETGFALRIGIPMVRFVGHHLLSTRTPLGRKLRPQFLKAANPRVRVKLKDLQEAGVQCVPRVSRIEGGRPVLEDGRVLEVANLIWCTGYSSGFSWIDLPIWSGPEGQEPRHRRGVVEDQPGLYFVGLHFLFAATSDTVTGMQRDALHIAKHLHSRMERRPLLLGSAPTFESDAQGLRG